MRHRPPPYQIIFNWDGTPHGYSEYPQSLDQLLNHAYAPLENTQVGAMFWCVGTDEASWSSDAIPLRGDAENRCYETVTHMRRAESMRAMLEAGHNPHAALVERGRQLGLHVYASIRMNDNHFWSDKQRRLPPLKPEDMASVNRPGLTQLRKDHPEWCLGTEQAPRWAATSWNISVAQVRQHRFQYIAEACRSADWDGVELDWQRHAFHLPEDDAYRLRYTLTDLQRAVRQLADEIAAERGRPFYVAVRVGASLETCRRVGYDLETWLDEDLCDIVATNANSGTDPGVEVEEYLELGKKNEVQLYPGFDSHWESGKDRLVPAKEWLAAWQRGLTKGYYDRGAHGIYIFNWHATRNSHRHLLTTLGNSDTLAQTDKVYDPVYRFQRARSELRYGAEHDDRLYGELPVGLYPTLTGCGPTFHLSVHDDVQAAAASGDLAALELHIELEHYSPADEVEVMLNGAILPQATINNITAQNPADPADAHENSWLVWSLTPEQLHVGEHVIEVRLVKQDPRINPVLVVQHVEVHIKYN